MATTVAASATTDREIVTSRVYDAPRERVFDAWTDREQIASWWGPSGFTTTTHEMNVRADGWWRFIMHGPDGRDYKNEIHYREVLRPERIVYDHVSTPHFRTTVTLEEVRGKTRLTMRALFDWAADREHVVRVFHAIEGAQQTLARLATFLS